MTDAPGVLQRLFKRRPVYVMEHILELERALDNLDMSLGLREMAQVCLMYQCVVRHVREFQPDLWHEYQMAYGDWKP